MRKTLLFLLFTAIFSVSNVLAQNGYKVGDKVESFVAKDENGKKWKAKKVLGKKNVVIYFYPAAMTGGCTKQACAYRDDVSNLEKLDAVVVGVSADEPEGLKLFKEAHQLNFTLLSDEGGLIAKQFGVPVKEGEKKIKKLINGIEFTLNRTATTARWTFVVGKDGKILYLSDKVNAAEDSKAVIAALQNAQK